MAWSEHIHIHVHNDGMNKVIELLQEIKTILSGNGNDEHLKQEIMDKLNKAIEDIKSTV